MPNVVLLIHAAATLMMVGVIWIVQVVHYPLFDLVDPQRSDLFAQRHQQSITWVVAPLMLVELTTAVWLLWRVPAGIPRWTLIAGAVLLAVIWISTLTLQIPRHTLLLEGFSAEVHRSLVASNWIRTLAWTARGALVMLGLAALLRAT